MKNILAGFFMATTMFLIIGATQEMLVTTSENGRYQAFGTELARYMIDTKNGKLYFISNKIINDTKNRVWEEMTADTDWIRE